MNTHSALSQMNRFRDELDRVFGADAMQWARPVAYPLVNIWEDENGFFVQAEVPGLTMEDLEIYPRRRRTDHQGCSQADRNRRHVATSRTGLWRIRAHLQACRCHRHRKGFRRIEGRNLEDHFAQKRSGQAEENRSESHELINGR